MTADRPTLDSSHRQAATKRPRLSVLVALTLTLLASACSGTGPTQGDVSRSVADEVIVPTFVAAADATERLHSAATSFCEAPQSVDIETVRSAWNEARKAWWRTDAMTFGPRGMSRSVSIIDHTTVDADSIDALWSSGTPPDEAAVASTLSAKSRGLGGVEHLLFTGDFTDSARCSLLTAYTGSITAAATGITDEWTDGVDGEAPYRDVFVGEVGSMDGRAGVKEIVEDVVFALRAMSTFGVGRAMGVSSPEPDPDAVTEGAAGLGSEQYAARIEGIASMYVGGESGVGLTSLVAAQSEEVDARITELLTELPGLFGAVGSPLQGRLLDTPDEAAALLEALDELRILFEVDVVSLLDITIGFSDTDGDT